MRTRHTVTVAASLAAAVVLAGCGSSSPAPSGAGAATSAGGNAKTASAIAMSSASARIWSSPLCPEERTSRAAERGAASPASNPFRRAGCGLAALDLPK